MSFFSKLLGKKTTPDPPIPDPVAALDRVREVQQKEFEKKRKRLAASGLLPPPSLRVVYKCECGKDLQVSLSEFNVLGGEEITCAHCGAVFFLPPEILDHTPESGKFTADLRPDWMNLSRFIKHKSP